jgi:hypothetical protein
VKHPQVVLCAFDDWLATQLRELVAERRWVLREFRQTAAWVAAAAVRQPCVAVVQADFTAPEPVALAAVAELHGRNPDADVVVVSDTKMGDDDRPGWAAAVTDLGGRLVLFPPLTRAVVEDAVGGLLGARVRRAAPPVRPAAIDLAAGRYEDES